MQCRVGLSASARRLRRLTLQENDKANPLIYTKSKRTFSHFLQVKVTITQLSTAYIMQNEVAVYTKLPNGFYINTPVGHYNPDWAIVFKEEPDIKHIYFVAETKGYRNDEVTDYRETERVKIECAKRHFETISSSSVTYGVVKDYEELRNIITS